MKPRKIPHKSKSEVAKAKDRIQSLLRQIVILRDGGCVLRDYPSAGDCGGYRNDGNLILQAEHLVTRARSVSYADTRNVVCLCRHHHRHWKPQNSRLYWEIIEKVIGPKRWTWIKRVEADRKSYQFNLSDWIKEEIALTHELQALQSGGNS